MQDFKSQRTVVKVVIVSIIHRIIIGIEIILQNKKGAKRNLSAAVQSADGFYHLLRHVTGRTKESNGASKQRLYRNVIATAYREGFLSSLRRNQIKAESTGGMSVKEETILNGSEPDLSVEMLARIAELTEKYVSEVIQKEKEQRKI